MTFTLRVQRSGEDIVKETKAQKDEPRFLLDDAETRQWDLNLTVCAVSRSFPDTPVCADPLIVHEGEKASMVFVTQTIVICTVCMCEKIIVEFMVTEVAPPQIQETRVEEGKISVAKKDNG